MSGEASKNSAICAWVDEHFAEADGNVGNTASILGTGPDEDFFIFDRPTVKFGAADDEMFDALKRSEAVGELHRSPREWLDGARGVVSIFFPFSEALRSRAAADREMDGSVPRVPPEWLIGRIEGQDHIKSFVLALAEWMTSQGMKAIAPSVDPSFQQVKTDPDERGVVRCITSWSERHVAYICGMGTFGLSRGLITERGVAGRFGSVVTTAEVEPTPRRYSELYEWCSMCGACAERCPHGAISLEHGKSHAICGPKVYDERLARGLRIGCGFCQTKVPCEKQVPRARR